MAIDTGANSVKEYRIALIAESTVNTANVTTMQLVNIDEYTLPELNPVLVNDVRSGVGRTAKILDNFECKKGVLKTMTFTGIADTTVLPLLVSNAMTIAVSASPASFDIPYNYNTPAILGGAAGSDITKTFTMAYVSPETNDSIIIPGCVCTQLVLNVGSIGEENGRVRFTATVQSRSLESRGQAAPSSMAAYTNTFYYISQWTTTKTVAKIAECVIASYQLTIDNPAVFDGFDTNGDPEVWSRGNPEVMATSVATVKHDSNTQAILTNFGDDDDAKLTEISNHGTWATATGFGVRAANGSVTGVALNDQTSMYYDVTIKHLATTSGDLIQLIV